MDGGRASLLAPATPEGFVYAATDGSGGDERLHGRGRRCGWAWVLLAGTGSTATVAAAERGGVEGAQTVPRAELRAIDALCRALGAHPAAPTTTVVVFSDCAYAVQGVRRLRGGWRPSPATRNGDLWEALAGHLDGALTYVDIRKVRAHQERPGPAASDAELAAWIGNEAADQRARRAADAHAHSAGDALVVERTLATAKVVQARLLAVGKYVVTHVPDAPREARPPRVPLRQRLASASATHGHRLLPRTGGRVECGRCGRRSGLRAAPEWSARECTRDGEGHRIRDVPGMRGCLRCGAWARDGASASRLRAPCEGVTRCPHQANLVRRFSGAPPLPPPHLPAWPDGTLVDRRRRGRPGGWGGGVGLAGSVGKRPRRQ